MTEILAGIIWRFICGLLVGWIADLRGFRFWPYFWFGVIGGLFIPLITLRIARLQYTTG